VKTVDVKAESPETPRVTPRRWVRSGWMLLVGTLGLVLAGCSNDGRPLTTLDPQAKESNSIHDLAKPVFIVAGIVFVLVEGAVLFLVIRFRRRKGEEDGVDEPVQLHGNSKLEWAWTIAPALVLAVMAVGNITTIWDLENDQVNATTRVDVIGQQWWWEYRYDIDDDGKSDIITANQLVIPVGETIGLNIRSNDVIHSFWIPALNGKKDAVPGRAHGLSFTADKPGLYQGQCTEYCGLSHGYMRMEVKVLDREDYDIWVAHQLKPAAEPELGTSAAAGKELFFPLCSTCHQINGYAKDGTKTGEGPSDDYLDGNIPEKSGNAPNLTHLMSRRHFAGNMFPLYLDDADAMSPIPEGEVDAGYLSRWLKDPTAMKPMDPTAEQGMPNYQLTYADIEKLVAFLATLK
jgi:cytochrome c oxidase subunit 2